MPEKARIKRSTNRVKKIQRRPNSNKAAIKVVGIGGGGGNVVSRMKDSFSVRGVEFIALNTDVQDLDFCDAHKKLPIGGNVTRGLGTGMNPALGKQAAEENRTEIADTLSGADLIFIAAGLGGGTGSGASPVVAEVAKELGALTVAVVTKPFSFEGGQRAKIAEEALSQLKGKVDSYIVIPNDRIFSIIGKDTSINKAFEKIDDVLRGAVQGIAELIAAAGIINADFADVKSIMKDSGPALVGIGVGRGKERGINAVREVLNSPLLDSSIDGARGILFGISGGRDLKMMEISEVAKMITENADSAARIKFGAYHSRRVEKGAIKITLIATGLGAEGLAAKDLSRKNESDKVEVKINPLFNVEEKQENKARKTEEREEKTSLPSSFSVKKNLSAGKNRGGSHSSINRSSQNKKKRPTEIWDIPAFLRRGRKK